jgi:hypothetical protein
VNLKRGWSTIARHSKENFKFFGQYEFVTI